MTVIGMLNIRDRLEAAIKGPLGFISDGASVSIVSPPLADISGTIDGKRYSITIRALDDSYVVGAGEFEGPAPDLPTEVPA